MIRRGVLRFCRLRARRLEKKPNVKQLIWLLDALGDQIAVLRCSARSSGLTRLDAERGRARRNGTYLE